MKWSKEDTWNHARQILKTSFMKSYEIFDKKNKFLAFTKLSNYYLLIQNHAELYLKFCYIETYLLVTK